MPMPMVSGYYRWPGIVELQGKSFFVQWFRADNFSFLFGQCFNVTFRVVTAPGYEKFSMKIPLYSAHPRRRMHITLPVEHAA